MRKSSKKEYLDELWEENSYQNKLNDIFNYKEDTHPDFRNLEAEKGEEDQEEDKEDDTFFFMRDKKLNNNIKSIYKQNASDTMLIIDTIDS